MARNVVMSLRTIPLLGIFMLAVLSSQGASAQDGRGPLTLQKALSLALRENPELASFAWEIRARDGQVLQASLLPNPEVGVEVENFGGRGEVAGVDGAETTVQLNQTILLGGKRAKRTEVASLGQDLARWDYESKRLDVIAETTRVFTDVLAAQERVALAEELDALAQSVFDMTRQRVEAGKVSPIEETKAKVALSTSRIEQQQAMHELDASRRRLATLWGAAELTFEEVEGMLEATAPVPPVDVFVDLIAENPDIGRWDAEMEQRRAVLALEKAGRVPDLTLGGGVRYVGEADSHAFVMEAGLPIPSFDRNQGGILEARRRLSQLEHQRRTAEVRVLGELSEAYGRLSAAFAEAQGLKIDVLPGAQSVFDAAREGYRQGKFGYLDVLDAQRTLFQAKGKYIEALASYQKARADIERAIGASVKDLKGNTDDEDEMETDGS
jgi:cobalt-zinc-cadmium efflux system outer membrane protein